MISQDLIKEAKENRKELHKIPEIGRCEFKTRKFCIDYLLKFGFKITDCFETGFYADLIIDDKFDLIAFRADMDALPAKDLTNDEASSTHDGFSHNCGHDTHMATLLLFGAAASQNKENLKANIRLLFQPSEEMFRGGAKGMIENGCLNGVSEVYGLHNDPRIKVGEISISDSIMSSNGTQYEIKIIGKSAHGSTPHLAKDALNEAVRFINEFNKISALCNPNEMKLISNCILQAGTAPNIVANEAFLAGSIRSFKPEIQEYLMQKVKEVIKTSEVLGFSHDIVFKEYPAIINHEKSVQKIRKICESLDIKAIDNGPMGGSEDFSYFIQDLPGAFFFLGSGNEKINNPLHSNPFYIDDNCLEVGAKIFLELVK